MNGALRLLSRFAEERDHTPTRNIQTNIYTDTQRHPGLKFNSIDIHTLLKIVLNQIIITYPLKSESVIQIKGL